MLRDGHTTAGTITLTPDAEDGLWTDEELTDSSMFINKLTVAREYAGHNLGGRLLDWAGDRACRAGPGGFDWMHGRRATRFSGTT